jgi:pimeloyl-ACP methyl ester carboxylesterase
MAECPILLITGDPNRGAIITPEMVRQCAALWKQGQEAHIPEAGHGIRREKFDLYMQKVSSFLGM